MPEKRFEPENEMGVVILFAMEAASAGYEIVKAQRKFPDLLIRKNGKEYSAEVEYMARNFEKHHHDPRKCDVIICWIDDYREGVDLWNINPSWPRSKSPPLPVLSLADPGWKNQELVISDPTQGELFTCEGKKTRKIYRRTVGASSSKWQNQ